MSVEHSPETKCKPLPLGFSNAYDLGVEWLVAKMNYSGRCATYP
ncbi:MAG: hypothetical protein QXS06_01475 [Desulfurococcaceae archaeon]